MAKIPFEFVLEALSKARPRTRPMFGCYGVYIGDKIVMALRRREDHEADNGVWLATKKEYHTSLKKEFPSLRSISLFGVEKTGWQNLPEDADDFEESIIRICDLIMSADPRIGKIPTPKKKSDR